MIDTHAQDIMGSYEDGEIATVRDIAQKIVSIHTAHYPKERELIREQWRPEPATTAEISRGKLTLDPSIERFRNTEFTS